MSKFKIGSITGKNNIVANNSIIENHFTNCGNYSFCLFNPNVKIIRCTELESDKGKVEMVLGKLNGGIEIYTRPQGLTIFQYSKLPKHCHVIITIDSELKRDLFFEYFRRKNIVEYLEGETNKIKAAKSKIIIPVKSKIFRA